MANLTGMLPDEVDVVVPCAPIVFVNECDAAASPKGLRDERPELVEGDRRHVRQPEAEEDGVATRRSGCQSKMSALT